MARLNWEVYTDFVNEYSQPRSSCVSGRLAKAILGLYSELNEYNSDRCTDELGDVLFWLTAIASAYNALLRELTLQDLGYDLSIDSISSRGDAENFLKFTDVSKAMDNLIDKSEKIIRNDRVRNREKRKNDAVVIKMAFTTIFKFVDEEAVRLGIMDLIALAELNKYKLTVRHS